MVALLALLARARIPTWFHAEPVFPERSPINPAKRAILVLGRAAEIHQRTALWAVHGSGQVLATPRAAS